MSYTTTVDKQDSNVTYTGNWTGLEGGTLVTLENASNVSKGAATFGNKGGGGRPIANGSGSGKRNLIPGTDFEYDKRLDASTTEDPADGFGSVSGGIYDTGTSGSLATGKYMRVVENTRNLKNIAGLNLDIYAKSQTLATAVSPPKERGYIDPVTGVVVLPRPLYYSKCENLNNLVNAEIKYSSYPPVYSYPTYLNPVGKFGNCIGSYAAFFGSAFWSNIYPFGYNNLNMSSGTASFWANNALGTAGTAVTYFHFGLNSYFQTFANSVVGYYYALVINGVALPSVPGSGGWNHIYIVWSNSGDLSGGSAVKVWADGTLIYDTATRPSNTINLFWESYVDVGGLVGSYNAAYLDNLKVWNHVVGESPNFEYNSGTGREEAYHSIYSIANNYQPKLTGSNCGVGYYYLASNTDPATLSQADASGASAVISLR